MRLRRTFYVLAIILPVIFAMLYWTGYVLGFRVDDPLIDGLGIEALGAIITAFLAVFLDMQFGETLRKDAGESPAPDLENEIASMRQEISELKELLMRQHEGDDSQQPA